MSTYAQKKGFGATLWDYLTTVDHKKIAILYLIAGGFFFFVADLKQFLSASSLQYQIMIL